MLNWQALLNKFYFQVFSGRLFITLGFFVFGIYTGRRKLFETPEASKLLIRKISKRGGLIVLFTVAVAAGMYFINAALKLGWQENPVLSFVFGVIFDVNSAAMVLFYISGLTMLMYQRR
ncbi:hypothetical protein BH10BAC3_BH10BAC3_20480 [soil metagenome]